MNTLTLVSLGEVRTAKDNRQFYSATFKDPKNPFGRKVSRNFWQQFDSSGNPIWREADPEEIKPFIGKQVPGKIVTAKVEPYTIVDNTGQERTANTYTAVILGPELVEAVFKSNGHKLASENVEVTANGYTEPLEII